MIYELTEYYKLSTWNPMVRLLFESYGPIILQVTPS